MRSLLIPTVPVLWSFALFGQGSAPDSTGLPGDDFSLSGALDLFQHATDLAAFEQALNVADNHVNNLDLDGDGEVDYIRVTDHQDGDAHAIVMQVAVSQDESQDVAVIELEKTGKDSAVLQIRGAEALYGPDVILEPYAEEDAGMHPSRGPSVPELVRVRVWVNVWAWPCVTWIYGPTYVAWASPWHWGYHPRWWRPWRPHPNRVFIAWQRPRMPMYRPVRVCRVQRAERVYVAHAVHSPRIQQRTAPMIQRRNGMRPVDERHMQRRGTERRSAPVDRRPGRSQERRMHR